MRKRWIIGIDEVGRGALAGPVVISAIAFPINYRGLTHIVEWRGRDSKQLSGKQREHLRNLFHVDPKILYRIGFVSSKRIDVLGMTGAISLGVLSAIMKFPDALVANARFMLDGGLHMPSPYRQLTIIRGDAQLPVIAAASIIAKVHRDQIMHRAHKTFPQYGFDAHVGYGTKQHYEALRRHGPSLIHRKSFRLT